MSDDVLYGLKYIALHRTEVPDKDITFSDLVNYAKWQLCQARNKLWLDPIWEKYTDEELLIEFFSIKFDNSPEVKEEFKKTTIVATKDDMDWFDSMEKALKEKQEPNKAIINKDETENKPENAPELSEALDFEDKY